MDYEIENHEHILFLNEFVLKMKKYVYKINILTSFGFTDERQFIFTAQSAPSSCIVLGTVYLRAHLLQIFHTHINQSHSLIKVSSLSSRCEFYNISARSIAFNKIDLYYLRKKFHSYR